MAKRINYHLSELGSTGLKRFHGRIYEEYLRELQGERWRRTVAEMVNDPIVGAVLFAVEMLIRQVQWQVEPFEEEDANDAEIAEFVESCLNDMSITWSDTVAEILTMLPYGWAMFETVFKLREGDNPNPKRRSQHNDGRIGWRKWGIRSQDTLWQWDFDDDGGIQGMWQYPPPTYEKIFIPIDKALLFRTAVRKGNPEGRSVLRSAYRAWYFRRNIENIEGIGIERDLAGLPVAFVPPELLSSAATDEQSQLLATIKELVVNIRRDEQEGVIWPNAFDEHNNKLFDLQLLSTGGTRQFDTDKVIARYDQRIAMSVLADFILLGHEGTGAYALSQDKTDLFTTAIEAWLDSIASTINRHAIPRLLKLNGMDTSRPPKLVAGEITKINIQDLGDYVSKLSGSGAITFDNEMERHLRQQADLPPLDDDEERERQQRGSLESMLQSVNMAEPVSMSEQVAMIEAAQRVLARGV